MLLIRLMIPQSADDKIKVQKESKRDSFRETNDKLLMKEILQSKIDLQLGRKWYVRIEREGRGA